MGPSVLFPFTNILILNDTILVPTNNRSSKGSCTSVLWFVYVVSDVIGSVFVTMYVNAKHSSKAVLPHDALMHECSPGKSHKRPAFMHHANYTGLMHTQRVVMMHKCSTGELLTIGCISDVTVSQG